MPVRGKQHSTYGIFPLHIEVFLITILTMKRKFLLTALTLCALGLASCQQPVEPDPDPVEPIDPEKIVGTKLDTQYMIEDDRLAISNMNRQVFTYKSQDELTNIRDGYLSPYTIFTERGHEEVLGEDIFAPYDDAFFENHILFCGIMDLAEGCELYFDYLDAETVTSPYVDNGNKNFFRICFEWVYPDETYAPDFIGDDDMSKYNLTYWFYAYEIPEDSTVAKEYVKYANFTSISSREEVDAYDYSTILWSNGDKFLSNQD